MSVRSLKIRPVVVLVLLGASLASAQDGGQTLGGGYVVGPPVSWPLGTLSPLWGDTQGRLIASSTMNPGPTCYSTDGGTTQFRQELVPTVRAELLGARAGQSTYVIVSDSVPAQVYRASCTSAPQLLGSYTFPPGFARAGALTVPIDSTGALHYAVTAGIAKLALTPQIAATLEVSKAELRALLGLASSVADTDLGVSALTGTPTDELVFVVTVPDPTLGSRAWVISRSAAGAMRVVWSRNVGGWKLGMMAAYSPELDAVIIQGLRASRGHRLTTALLGVVTRTRSFDPELQFPPFPPRPSFGPSAPEMDWLVGGSTGVWAAFGAESGWQLNGLYPLTIVPSLADFDRDGLRASEEAALGTSDFLADTDGDGSDDFAEARRWSTSPLDAGSVVAPLPVDGTVLGASLVPQWWRLPGGALGQASQTRETFAPVFCRHECVGEDLKPLAGADPRLVHHFPLPVDGGAQDIAHVQVVDAQWAKRNLVTRQTTPFDLPQVYAPRGIIPLDDDTGFLETDGTAIWRVSAAGVAPFAVIDTRRVACPILSAASELSRCGVEPELIEPGLRDVHVIGFDAERRMILVNVNTAWSRFLLGMDANRVVRLADLTTAADGYEIDKLVAMKPMGSTGYLALVPGGADEMDRAPMSATFRLDDQFHQVPSRQPIVDSTSDLVFRGGLLDTLGQAWFIEPATVAGPTCVAVGGILYCDLAPPATPRVLQFTALGQWLPIREAIEPGEVIFWSSRRDQMSRLAGSRNPLTGLYEDYNQTQWILWRTTPLGATTEWLREYEFKNRLSAADRAELTTTALGPITFLAASPDGLRFCLTEAAAARTWELRLDPATRILSSITLASRSAAAACAYDEAGRLALLGGTPLSISVEGSSLLVPGITAPIGLYRIGGRWIVQAHEQPALCVDDQGSVSQPQVAARALSWAPGGIAYVDGEGQGFTNTVAGFCSAGAPRERLADPLHNLWSQLYWLFNFRSQNAVKAVMAVRPDGVALITASELKTPNFSGQSPFVYNSVFYLQPEYRPLAGAGLPEHEAFRRTGRVDPGGTSLSGLVAFQPTLVTAMALVPGADAGRDWGYLERLGEPYVPEPEQPAADAGVEAPPPVTKPGCGCGGAEGSVLLALLVLLRRKKGTG